MDVLVTSKNQNSNISNEMAEIAIFRFSSYKSKETLSCHSNQSSGTRIIKNTNFVEANIISMYAKFQLHLPYSFWKENFLIFFRKFTLYVAIATKRIKRF